MSDIDAAIALLTDLAEGRRPIEDFAIARGGDRLPDGSIAMPWVDYTPLVDRLWPALAAAGFDPNAVLDYGRWQKPFGAGVDDPATIAAMSADDLRHLIVRFRRGERFSEGFHRHLLASGAMLAAFRRVREVGPPAATA